MQKKVMAVAVATALAAPAVALAQGSSVQIYGALSVSGEYAQAKGADTNNAPAAGTGGSSIRGGNVGGGAYVATGSSTPNVNEPGRMRTQGAGSNFGIRGREDLGNGLYMGFQAEASIAIGGVTPASPGGNALFAGWRNTGLWLGGRWGEAGLGLWDLPFNMNQTTGAGHAPYANASTNMSAGLLGGGLGSTAAGTVSGQDFGQFCGITAPAGGNASGMPGASVSTCFNDAFSFHRRQSNQLWYQAPNWAGFTGRLSYGATSGSTNNASNESPPAPSKVKPQLWGANVSYTLGGLYAGLGWEHHDDYITSHARLMGANGAMTGACAANFGAGLPGFALGGNTAGVGVNSTAACMPVGTASTVGLSGDNSDAWNANLRYTFGFGLSIGGYYEWTKWKMNYGNTTGNEIGLTSEIKRQAWRLDAAYQLGAHTFGVQYGQGNKLDGSVSNGSFENSGTRTNEWILGYAYSLSKRSSIFGYYTQVNNDTNSRSSGIVFNGIGPNAGGDPRYIGVGLRHLF